MDVEPKKYVYARIPEVENFCFVIMPFANKFCGIYGEIKNFLECNGYTCNRADELIDNGHIIIKSILENIKKAQFIIVDITDLNPNVFYELGIVHCLKSIDNVIIIKEQDTKTPFDISHIRYIEYSEKNMYKLRSDILDVVDGRKKYFNFKKELKIRNIISYMEDASDYTLEIINNKLKEQLVVINDILSRNTGTITKEKTKNTLRAYIEVLKGEIHGSEEAVMQALLKTLAQLLIECSYSDITDEVLNDLLFDFFATLSSSNEKRIISWQTDVVLTLAYQKKKTEIISPWIINYFKKTKSTTIDLNRHRLERFLLKTTDAEYTKAMMFALADKDCHIREHMADIIGERQLDEAHEYLVDALKKEENYFSAASIIAALGKLTPNKNSLIAIKAWLKKHGDNAVKTDRLFVLRRAMDAFEKIDMTDKREYVRWFDNSFYKALKNNLL